MWRGMSFVKPRNDKNLEASNVISRSQTSDERNVDCSHSKVRALSPAEHRREAVGFVQTKPSSPPAELLPGKRLHNDILPRS
jgi:hypothetical protein